MVAMTLFFRRRLDEDINNYNYITDIDPYTFVSGFPLYREITHPDFDSNTYDYKSVTDNDIYGMYTTFLVRAPRKMRQNKLQVTIQQKSNSFHIPLFFIGLFGFRPGLYDEATQTFTPLQDYFTFDRGVNMMCDNTSADMKSNDVASIGGVLEGLGVAPSTILYAGGSSTYRDFPLHDASLITAFQTTNTIVAHNNVYTTHDLVTPLFNHVPDVNNLGDSIVLQAKLNVYLAYSDYSSTTQSKLRLIEADHIISLGGDFDVI